MNQFLLIGFNVRIVLVRIDSVRIVLEGFIGDT